MMLKILVLLALAASSARADDWYDCTSDNTTWCEATELPIPDTIMIGAATAAYQIEGSWNISKTDSIWDHLFHEENSCFTTECSNGDDACMSYTLYERDVEMIAELGLDFYRMSISWPRILPYGFANETNADGIAYYNTLIDLLVSYNITPVVTIYHWDMPENLQQLGGWANPEMATWLADYANVLFENFGDRVPYWITINEPKEICVFGYGTGSFAPRINASGIGDYLCARNLLLAHAAVYHLYDDNYRADQGGYVGITMDGRWYEPASDSDDDSEASLDAMAFEIDIYANPIFGTGDWPTRVSEKVANNSEAEGFPRSRLPAFNETEIDYILGSYDFFGLNHYTSSMIYRNASTVGSYAEPSTNYDMNVTTYQPSSWNSTSWTTPVPWGFYKLLTKIREDYSNPPLFVTENGFAITLALNSSSVEDSTRVKYHRDYIKAMLQAVDEGSDVIGYAVWSLMDNFSWKRGYRTRFGLFETDYTSSNRTRSPRQSAYVFKEMISTRYLNYSYVPDMTVDLTIDE